MLATVYIVELYLYLYEMSFLEIKRLSLKTATRWRYDEEIRLLKNIWTIS